MARMLLSHKYFSFSGSQWSGIEKWFVMGGEVAVAVALVSTVKSIMHCNLQLERHLLYFTPTFPHITIRAQRGYLSETDLKAVFTSSIHQS